ncbi:DUF2125 domain-containing protein [Limimaricola hongkongensis]|uniref:DUF2125 domain-containing protein n=1 Tax=Limimaricola hongkongensis DSM 17492 TaxID=1122180 RepID=A0A017HHP9_9RHOB|nr:DUF2125 domain-containing protein [Limimaricola hongkongensis]EYD73319.1 hypothetical protein Lokhon_00849 [Limimaricola hongkongensis DSM 17492]
MAALSKTAPIGALALMAGAAQADVTAEQVWQDWQEGAARLGETRIETGAEQRSGDRLTITDLVLTMQGEDGELVARLPEIVFAETGDGAVEVTLSDSYPIEISGTDEDGVQTEIELSMQQTGLEVTVSGDPGAMRYDYAADRYALVLDRLVEDGETIPAEAMLALNAVRGSYLSETAASGLRRTDYDITAETLDLMIEGEDSAGDAGGDTGGSMAIDASVAEIAISGALALPEGMEEAEALPDDFSLVFDYATGPALVEFEGEGEDGRAAGTARTASSTVGLSLDPARVSYASSTKGLDLTLTDGPMPFPVEISAAEYGFGLDAPLAAGEAAQDLSARITLDSLTLGDPVWALFDPAEVLPRTPATLIAELSGTARLPQDLTDPGTAEAMGEAVGDGEGAAMAEAAPEIESLTLDRLVLRLAGAELLGDGGFTFDNSDFETFPGFPRPEGRIDLKIDGLNGLIENLSTLGVIPAEQLMGARMMLGLFTTSIGNDELTSTIEINPEGHVIANGQRIQ